MYDLIPYPMDTEETLFIHLFCCGVPVSTRNDFFIRTKILPYDKTTEEYQERIHKHNNTMKFIINNDCLWIYQDYSSTCARLMLEPERQDLKDYYYYLCDYIWYINEQIKDDSLAVFQAHFRQARLKIARVENRLNSFRDFVNDDYKLYFCTITLDDTNFNVPLGCYQITSDSYDKIRRKLREHIKEYSDIYLFNKDFGLQETKRLHFHGVALVKKGMLPSLSRNTKSDFGQVCSFKEIDDHSDYLSKYIEKLSYHALKVNYGKFRENLIYSRKVSI